MCVCPSDPASCHRRQAQLGQRGVEPCGGGRGCGHHSLPAAGCLLRSAPVCAGGCGALLGGSPAGLWAPGLHLLLAGELLSIEQAVSQQDLNYPFAAFLTLTCNVSICGVAKACGFWLLASASLEGKGLTGAAVAAKATGLCCRQLCHGQRHTCPAPQHSCLQYWSIAFTAVSAPLRPSVH